MSVLVISLVVWLVVVFLSVTAGIEKNWLRKLTSLHAPIRLSPTNAFYSSYYYQIDKLSAASNYTLKSIGEKGASGISDPYSVDVDAEIPIYWPKADRLKDGELRDPVKIAMRELEALRKEIPGLSFQDYEIGGALLRLTLHRPTETTPSSLSQMSYLLSLSEENPRFRDLIIEPQTDDLKHLLAIDPTQIENIDAETGKAKIDFKEKPLHPPAWIYFVNGKCHLPEPEKKSGREISALLPKNFRESGVLLGDTGTLNYTAQAALSSQEQKIAIRVAGFYDPGILSIGNKCLIVP